MASGFTPLLATHVIFIESLLVPLTIVTALSITPCDASPPLNCNDTSGVGVPATLDTSVQLYVPLVPTRKQRFGIGSTKIGESVIGGKYTHNTL